MVKNSCVGYNDTIPIKEVRPLNRFAQRLDAFCARNSRKGIPNLMLFIVIGNILVYVLTMMDPTHFSVYSALVFDRSAILRGQVWRLFTCFFATLGTADFGDTVMTLLTLYFTYYCGRMIERQTGTLKLNLYYFGAAVITLVFSMLTGWFVTPDSLNLTLILVFAMLYGDAQILLFMFIPLKARYVGWLYLILMPIQCVRYLSLMPLVPLIPLALFFWNQLPALLPDSWRWKLRNRPATKQTKARPGPNWAAGYQSKSSRPAYQHRCTVCGRTNVDSPGLDFRYCSRCSGYRCYCMDHINDHAHIVDTE